MAKQTEFQRQLSDPRWQKKRLQILERDEWTCKACGDTKATLTCHHKSYRMKGGIFADVWDYCDDDLITLCDKCHGDEEDKLKMWQKHLYFLTRSYVENAEVFQAVTDMLYTIKDDNNRLVTTSDIIDIFYSSDHCKKHKKDGGK